MKSIEYQCTWRDAVKLVLPMLAVLGAVAVLLRVSAQQGWLPEPAIALDPDTTVLAHQARAATNGPPAEILVVGDSTCLVGVDARALSRQLIDQPRVLSLASFIWMDLASYGQMIADYSAAHHGLPRSVVLLVSAPKLASATAGDGDVTSGNGLPSAPAQSKPADDRPRDWIGAAGFRTHLLSHCLAAPLHGSGASFFGFSSSIDDYMTEHAGSLITFGTAVTPRGMVRSAWKLSPALEPESRAFKAKIPAGTRLFIGLTPGPAGTAATGHWREDLLQAWNQWLAADVLLTNLPATYPDVYFSAGGHLNEPGQRRFTTALARELSINQPRP